MHQLIILQSLIKNCKTIKYIYDYYMIKMSLAPTSTRPDIIDPGFSAGGAPKFKKMHEMEKVLRSKGCVRGRVFRSTTGY